MAECRIPDRAEVVKMNSAVLPTKYRNYAVDKPYE